MLRTDGTMDSAMTVMVTEQWLASKVQSAPQCICEVVCGGAAYVGHNGATEWQNGLLPAALANWAMENVNLDDSALLDELAEQNAGAQG
ncbi:hypothetical protein HPB50_018008 [Hyalomma asiaticum]|uniref:Uncharacterized protein n=1 Tax=Hyalomma asiaticum TaxID=266040 RepID=A0ACB7RJC2_HYAAI|nr:hypothetical protein HPB50_018008 [Hyalomma asiaticum]